LVKPFKKSICCVIPVNEFAGDVNEDGVHSDYFKEEGPTFIAQYIDDVIKHR
jgi:hypothetical protein